MGAKFLVVLLLCSSTALSSELAVQYYYEPPADEQELTENINSRFSVLKKFVRRTWNDPIDVDAIKLNQIQFVDCENFLGGVEALKKEYRSGVRKGLECLSKVDEHRRADAKAYLAILKTFKTQITIVCHKGEDVKIKYFREQKVQAPSGATSWTFQPPGVITNWFGGGFGSAMATTLGHKRWPATILSVASFEERLAQGKVANVAKTFFHEGFHWLGYRHKNFMGAEPDLTVDAADCCIENDAAACKSLNTETYDPSPYLPES